jgi:hypothetical protein
LKTNKLVQKEKDYGLVKVPPIHGWTEFWIRITKENRFQVGRGTNFTPIFDQLLENFTPTFVAISKYDQTKIVNLRQIRIN